MVLAHIERDEPKPTQRALARARIRGGRPQPLPGPGVLSSGNSIGTPALLPDGTISTESVMSGVRAASAGPSELERGRVAGELEELDTRPEKGDEE
jgi:NADH-quinone oxidoreductase subunit J